MTRSWTFGHKIAFGFGTTVVFAVLVGVIAVLALRSVVVSMDQVAINSQNLFEAAMLDSATEQKSAAARGFLLTREGRFLDQMKAARADFMAALGRLKAHVHADSSKRLIDQIEGAEAEHQIAMDQVNEARKAEANIEAVSRLFEEQAMPRRDTLDKEVRDLISSEARLLSETRQNASYTASSAISGVLAVTVGAVLFACVVAYGLARGLARQIASAILHVQSSSAELQAAANQQASGAREQATAVSEISTTITELLATSRQIAESAQRVAHIAEQTATAAQSGDQTVQKSQDSGGGIKRQVDLIVTHMLDLGRKAQKEGAGDRRDPRDHQRARRADEHPRHQRHDRGCWSR
jgi:CHASE3 domain sensor protein